MGGIVSIENVKSLKNIPHVKEVFLDNIYPGKTITDFKDDTSKLGPILFCSATEDETLQAINKVKETLKISVINNSGAINGIIWE